MTDQNNAPGQAVCTRIARQLEIGGWHDAADYVRSAWMMSQIADLARADRAAPEWQVRAVIEASPRYTPCEHHGIPSMGLDPEGDWLDRAEVLSTLTPQPEGQVREVDRVHLEYAAKLAGKNGDDEGQEALLRILAALTPPPAVPTDNTALVEALRDARIQLEYVNEKQPRGTTTAAIARLDAALASREAPPASDSGEKPLCPVCYNRTDAELRTIGGFYSMESNCPECSPRAKERAKQDAERDMRQRAADSCLGLMTAQSARKFILALPLKHADREGWRHD